MKEFEARLRSPVFNAGVTMLALLVAFAPRLPGASIVLGNVSVREATLVAGVSWCAYEFATLTFHGLGHEHPVSVGAAAIDAFCRNAASLVLLFLSGSAASPLWLVGMALAFEWTPKPARWARFAVVNVLVSYLVLAAAFLVRANEGDAWLTLLVMLASLAVQTMTVRKVARSALVRAERDVLERRLHEATLRKDREKMARELHDGVGADVMALVLRLRRAAADDPTKGAARLAEKARDLLDELRGVVWSLRNEQGTLAELGKLIDAACRGARGAAHYERTTALEIAHERIGPRAALAALSLGREFVRRSAHRGGVAKVHLSIRVVRDRALELAIEDDGPTLTSEALLDLVAGIDVIPGAEGATRGPIDASIRPEGQGVRLHATILRDEMTRA